MKYLVTGLLALAATTASAHDPLPSANWCEHGQMTVAATFNFTENDVNAYIACVGNGSCPDPRPAVPATCSSLKSCGNFDDDYGKTALMINAHCAQFADTSVAGRPTAGTTNHPTDSVAPIVYGPQFFLSVSHHSRYNKSAGVYGVCAKCVLPPPAVGSVGN